MTLAEQMLAAIRGGLPKGGVLVDRRLAAGGLPWLVLTVAEQADLRALASGAYSPLFLGSWASAAPGGARVDAAARWHPVADPGGLGLPEDSRVDASRLALRDQGRGLLGVLEVSEVFARDRHAEAKLVYGTSGPAHPGVARVLAAPLDGPVGTSALTLA